MLTRLEKYRSELLKLRKKKTELDSKIKDLERKYKEEENSTIHEMVHAANMTPEQLHTLLQSSMQDKLDGIRQRSEEEKEQEDNE